MQRSSNRSVDQNELQAGQSAAAQNRRHHAPNLVLLPLLHHQRRQLELLPQKAAAMELFLLLLLLGRPDKRRVLLCFVLPISCTIAATIMGPPRRSGAGLLHLVWVLPPQGRWRLGVSGSQPRTAPARTTEQERNRHTHTHWHPWHFWGKRVSAKLHCPPASPLHRTPTCACSMMPHTKPQEHHQQPPAYLGVELSAANNLPAALDALRPRAPTPAAPTPAALLPAPAFCLPNVGVRLPAGPAAGGSGKPGKCPGVIKAGAHSSGSTGV